MSMPMGSKIQQRTSTAADNISGYLLKCYTTFTCNLIGFGKEDIAPYTGGQHVFDCPDIFHSCINTLGGTELTFSKCNQIEHEIDCIIHLGCTEQGTTRQLGNCPTAVSVVAVHKADIQRGQVCN